MAQPHPPQPPLAPPPACDVLVVGGGNAGFSAALSAREHGARHVVLVDKCPEDWAGGNSFFTAGAFRTVHAGLPDLLPLVNNVDAATAALVDLDPYTPADFSSDLTRVTAGRADPQLAAALIGDSNAAIKWLRRHGVRFQLSFNRQAYRVGGRFKFWGGMALMTDGGGAGLVEDLRAAAKRQGVHVFYNAAARRLVVDPSGAVAGVEIARSGGGTSTIRAPSVVLAAGGFEANPRMRAQHLGPGWDLALVRGTPFNTGDCLDMAVRDVAARPAGHWSGCHSVCWDADAPAHSGDREVSNQFTKSGYPLGLMLNSAGDRFVDEGVDLRNFTYARFGRAVLAQPDGIAFQLWDAKAEPWLRPEEYRDGVVLRKFRADTLEDLAAQLAAPGVGLRDSRRFLRTVTDYNAAATAFSRQNPSVRWDPAIRDGLSTGDALPLPKSNWALPLDQGPFLAVKVACGVTFTFGGLTVNPDTAAVVNSAAADVPGLFCAGEMLGGLFYGNYPGGSGLTSGTVFGRRAGKAAAARAGTAFKANL